MTAEQNGAEQKDRGPSRRAVLRRTFWRQTWWVIRKELRVELRGGETLWMAAPFAAMALLLAPLALGTDTALLRRIGPGMLWLVVVLFGMTVTVRPTSIESRPVRDLLTLSGLDPVAAFLGRSGASAALLFVFTLVLTPVMIVLYGPDSAPLWGCLLWLAVGAAVALGLLGTLVAALVTGLRSRTALAPIMSVPLAAPVLIAVVNGTENALNGQPATIWLLMLAAVDLILLIAGVMLAAPLDETTR